MQLFSQRDEQHQRVMRECFESLWQHSADFMFVMAVEPNGEFTLYDNNPASRKVMGLPMDTCVDHFNIRDLWDDEIVEGLYASYQQAIDAHKPVSFEQYATRGEDNAIFANTLLVPIYDKDDNPIFVCGVSRDISDRKAMEQMTLDANEKLQEYSQALENINKNLDDKVRERTCELEQTAQELEAALETKSSFVARMSHEIRTPINAVLGFCNLLNKTSLDDMQRDYIAKILDSGEVLLRQVNDILDFSKLEADSVSIENIEFELEPTIHQAININSLNADTKDLEIVLSLDSSVPQKLIGDPVRIKQILINLVNNAVKFTDSGYVSVNISAKPTGNCDKVLLEIDVQDTGIGITQEQQQRLFHSFSQADDSITRRFGGSGLGLVISRKYAQLMGGELSCKSTPGEGSCFHVSLPLGLVQNQSDSERHGSGDGFRVLVVDDLPISRQVLKTMLGELGYQVEVATDGYEAVEYVNQAFDIRQPFDVILLDWKMPRMDGIETSEQIHSRFQEQTPPILMISAYERQKMQAYCNDGLISSFIEKPVSPSSLFDAVESLLSRHLRMTKNTDPKVKQKDLSAYRLLLVEDNPINQQVAQGYLEDTHIHVDIANNGEQAIEFLSKNDVDIVLMDIQMPYMDGLTATQKLRQELGFDKPIIAMTAHVSDSAISECLHSGMDAHVGKPIDSVELFSVLLRYLASDNDLSHFKDHQEKGPLTHPQLCEALSQIQELNLQEAMSRIGGRNELYFSLLETFYSQYRHRHFIEQLQTATPEELRNFVHALKSNAAYIGAYELVNRCLELESELLDGEVQPQGLTLFESLEKLLVKLDPLLEHYLTEQSINSVNAFKQHLSQLEGQLRTADFAFEKTLKKLTSFVTRRDDLNRLQQIQNAVEEIELETAAKLVAQWRSAID
ncbi:response regulator [Celerinatantimonas diazotrophica]|uniref:histidine kinase n=1 Tax=Celerinatantimonas diazotrophica TaxID=412034 RepID=A0A4R1J7T6_9GAMM|nr:response regulator [Celerinatantimonas diazotrophica]TCK46411.1 PAS domain S-box-containing protein [Celerinatantimonas diazotrophica]CAG9295213.1 Sensor histidine kinase RcsC [Celerinatantimonas diazotrophica]